MLDIAGFGTPSIVVGEHPYLLASNRWGTKLNYVHGAFDAELGFFAAQGDLRGSSDFTNDTDKTVQWKIAYASAERPVEIGVYGSRGSFPLAEGGTDQYHSLAGYVQRDPIHHVPGILAVYQTGYDANPGAGAPPANSKAYTIELYEPVGDKAVLALRKELSDDGLGNVSHSGNVDFTYHVSTYVHAYLEAGLAQGGKPAWRWLLWYTLPVTGVK
ncbi:MAG: hypothetical protein GIW98_00360 [Candidatus Eremiobacteraeota bacterium]|nr:hypothetical protein [Candidatus Eremiobacteraeota bacterium]